MTGFKSRLCLLARADAQNVRRRAMTITKSYAERLIRQGKAVKTTTITEENGHQFQAIDRLDMQRVDHYRIK